jgi:stage III sporulation protein SpoIIIAA
MYNVVIENHSEVNLNDYVYKEQYNVCTSFQKEDFVTLKDGINNSDFLSDLEKLTVVLPPKITGEMKKRTLDDVIEVVMDIGRRGELRHLDKSIEYLGEDLVTEKDIEHVLSRIDDFTSDNRSGIPGTLHRISAIRNRKGKVIGLTCRVGRVVTGTINCIKDIVLAEKSILFLGRPGVGKTTKLREIARLLADDLAKRVIVVDTSNEIAGDGDVPHKAIGRSRRMQVLSPELQKDVMIEAVENHTPEVIVVDEIGTEQEAQAARTIAERGVMLVATAHGNILENLIKNPTLSDLVGGVNCVTLGDDEARRRSCQKSVLERAKQPTFDIIIEIRDKDTLAVYPNASEAVDCILRDWPVSPEIRKIDYNSEEKVKEAEIKIAEEKAAPPEQKVTFEAYVDKYLKESKNTKKLFIYAVSRSLVDKALERLAAEVEVTRNIDEADFVIAHKSYSTGGAKILTTAKEYHIPIHFVKTNTMPQIQKALKDSLGIKERPGDSYGMACFDETEEALKEAQAAVYKVLNGADSVELEPRKAHIRKLQHEIIEQHNLTATSIGTEPERHLKIISNKDLRQAG